MPRNWEAFNADPNFPRNDHFKPPTREEFENEQERHERVVDRARQMQEEEQAGTIIGRTKANAERFYRDWILSENPTITQNWLDRYVYRSAQEAETLEKQYGYFQERVREAIQDLHDFEVEKLNLTPRDRRVVEEKSSGSS